MISIACIFCRRDLGPLLLQARSIGMFFAKEAVFEVIYIFNDLGSIDSKFLAELRASLEPHSLTIWSSEEENFYLRAGVDGWLTQQALKLKVAHRIATDHYLVLDAKNHFIRPVNLDTFVKNGKPVAEVVSLGRLNETVHSSWISSQLYWGLNPVDWISDVIRPITPFVFDTGLVNSMVAEIAAKSGVKIGQFFAHSDPVLFEFFLYQGYLHSHGDHLALTTLAPSWNAVTIWRPLALSENVDAAIVDAINSPEVICFALHHSAVGVLTQASWELIVKLWQTSGLILNPDDSRKFTSVL